jgi:hypothetical protein
MNDRVYPFYLNNNDESQSQSSNICTKIEPQSQVIASVKVVRGQCPPYNFGQVYSWAFAHPTSAHPTTINTSDNEWQDAIRSKSLWQPMLVIDLWMLRYKHQLIVYLARQLFLVLLDYKCLKTARYY